MRATLRRRATGLALVAASFASVVSLVRRTSAAEPTPPAPASESAPAPESAPPELVPPVARATPSVPYPGVAKGSAVVVVELAIDASGVVTKATLVTGPEPFAAAALASATSWRFDPARRAGVAVASRIRVRVDFHPPAPAPPEPAEPAAPPKPPKPGEPVEVNVRGARAEVARTEMGAGEVRQMPGAFGDAFRAIDAMPGVTPIVSGLPYYFIRGAPPGNTGYLIDGIKVPLLFHFGVARAVVHPALIDHVDFYAGGYPAKYGRYAGGIIDGITKAPVDHFHGEWDVSLLHSGAFVETPFADGRGNVSVAGRYGYPGLLLSLLAPEVFLQYGDYQARASWRLGDHDTIGVFAFGSVDAAGSRKSDGSLTDVVSTQFHRVDTRWEHDLGKLGRVRTAVTLGLDRTGNQSDFAVRDLLVGVRTEWDAPISDTVHVRAGSDAWFDHYSLLANNSGGTAVAFPTRDDVVAGVRGDVVLRVAPRVEVIPGARVDLFESKSSTATHDDAIPTFDPRIATRVRLSRRVTWITTNGISHQAPSFIVPIPGLQLGTLGRGVQTAVQTSQGLEIELPLDLTFAPTVFLHNYLDLTDATATCGFSNAGSTDNNCIEERVRGRTYGFEALLRRPLTKRVTGWISYTLSRSTRDAHALGFNGDTIGAIARTDSILSDFDRTHVLNVIGAVDLGHNWRVGGRTLYYTGRPYSNQFHGIPVPPYNSQRLPDFFRIDLRIEKRWLTSTGYWAFIAEGLNVTANKEVLDVRCTAAPGRTTELDHCEPDTRGAIPVIVPLVGVEGAF
jgi:TonB family protein